MHMHKRSKPPEKSSVDNMRKTDLFQMNKYLESRLPDALVLFYYLDYRDYLNFLGYLGHLGDLDYLDLSCITRFTGSLKNHTDNLKLREK